MDHPSDRLSAILRSDGVAERVGDYFHGSKYEGRWFEQIGGGGDHHAVADVITAEDLVAVSMLSVTIPAYTAARLLLGQAGDLGADIAALLASIPTDVPLSHPDSDSLIGRGSSAWEAWDLLSREKGMGTTKVSKLLARKRPHLLPVMDDVVLCALGRPQEAWAFFRAAVASDGPAHDDVCRIRADADVPHDVSDLRIIDVAVWSQHQADHREH